jgi:exonuclease SbcD
MKLVHLSDLHLGKRVNEFSMIEDQEYILTRIINAIDDEKPQVVVIAGDIYDKAVPSAEAVELFDDFLVRLSKRELKVLVISGNHDSPERIAFGSRLMNHSGVYMSPVYDGNIEAISLDDEYGSVDFFLLPFIKPAHVKKFYPEVEIESYTDAIKKAVEEMHVDPDKRNVIITHQFVTGASLCESEERSVGGSDSIEGSVFDEFDYVALGHLHGPQKMGRETVRYCGTPLKYSFSEANHKKSISIIEFFEKGNIKIRETPLLPRRNLVEIRGKYNDLVEKSFYSDLNRDDYYHITLLDEEDILDAIAKLRVIYPNIMKLDYDNKRTREQFEILGSKNVDNKSPLELFGELYEIQNNQALEGEAYKFTEDLIRKVWEVQQ